MDRVKSRDGTEIAFEESGTGPPLVLVHGAAGDHTRWAPILPQLERNFTVIAVDRRGRGGSGDSDSYSLEREYEDIAAVVDATAEAMGGPVNLMGHSFGALCTLEASLITSNIAKLVLHEPPVAVASGTTAELVDRLQRHLDAGDLEGLMIDFMRDAVGMSEEDIRLFRSQPAWSARLAAAHTLPRELGGKYRFDPAPFRDMTTPTLVLLGSESTPIDAAGAFEVHRALPNSRLALLQGAEHVAIYRVPELVVEEVTSFLLEREPAAPA